MSAVGMSRVLGFGDNQYRLYEDGEMSSEAIGKMLFSMAARVLLFRRICE